MHAMCLNVGLLAKVCMCPVQVLLFKSIFGHISPYT